jgi:hypothetical protein
MTIVQFSGTAMEKRLKPLDEELTFEPDSTDGKRKKNKTI